MAIRDTRLVIKNNSIPDALFSGATLLRGEAIVNTADGILMFSGVTSSIRKWTSAGTGGNSNFFEVGSNLYDLKIRNQITAYSGVTDLSGKFLSGTTTGFVLADTSNIVGIDTYVTGGTYVIGGTIVFDYNTGGDFEVTGLTEDLNAAIDDLAETDELTIELDIFNNKVRLKDIVSAPAGGTRVFLGNTEIGTGGSYDVSGTGDLIVHGDLTVFGSATTVSTNELYIEDPQITLNYNPNESTDLTSVSSGIKIQDGNGITSGDTYLTIGLMQNLVSGNISEYTGFIGYNNRGWVTQLNDIVIRNTNLDSSAPDGVRVLTELDILDGGSY